MTAMLGTSTFNVSGEPGISMAGSGGGGGKFIGPGRGAAGANLIWPAPFELGPFGTCTWPKNWHKIERLWPPNGAGSTEAKTDEVCWHNLASFD